MDRVAVTFRHSDLWPGGPRGKSARRIFVAYRFVPESENFRSGLQRSLETDWGIETSHGGAINPGLDWSEEIRDRIRKSKLIVADVTDSSREVMFEIGFASNKPAIYVTARHEDRSRLPSWLTIRQAVAYGDDGIEKLSRAIGRYFADKKFPPVMRRATSPGTAVLLASQAGLEWAGSRVSAVEAALGEVGISLQYRDPDALLNGSDLAKAASCQLVFACIDGTTSDYLSHYLLGDVAGRPLITSVSPQGSRQHLRRLGVVLSRTKDDFEVFGAEGLRRVSNEVVFRPESTVDLQRRLLPILRAHRQWRNRGEIDGA